MNERRIVKTSIALVVGALVAGAVGSSAAQEAGVRLINDEDNREFVIVIGPVDLAAGMHHAHGAHGAVFPPVGTVRFPAGAYLKGFSYEVVDGDGNVLPPDIVHHLNFITPENRELFLPISQRLLAVGSETGSQSMPGWLLGVPIIEGQELVVTSMLHNPTGKAHSGVEVRMHLEYVKIGRPWPLLSVYPFQVDVAFPAGDKSVDLPPGTSQFSWEGSPSMEGRIMVIGSHLHELATHIRFEDVTSGEEIWEGRPIRNANGELEGVTVGRLYRKFGVKIFPDHRYRATVFYDNPTQDTIQAGGMGVVAGVFMPSGGGMWPKADASNELYALDRRHYLQEVRGSYDLIASGGGVIEPGAPSHEH